MDVSNLFLFFACCCWCYCVRLLLYSAIGSFVSFSHGYNYDILYSHTLIGVYWQVNHSNSLAIVPRYLSDNCAPQKLSRCVAKSKLRTNEVREKKIATRISHFCCHWTRVTALSYRYICIHILFNDTK